jgi:signal transduction histidine kinase
MEKSPKRALSLVGNRCMQEGHAFRSLAFDGQTGGKRLFMSVSQRDDRPLYSSRITNTYLKLIKRNYSYINVNELLRYAGIEPFQVEDEGHWFTQKQINRFHQRLQQLTGNVNISREAGLYAASPEVLGGIRQYILGLASMATAYRLAGKMSSKYSRSSTYQSRSIGPQQVEVLVTPNEGVREEPFQCENRMGYLEAIAKIFNYKLPKIEHPECMFRGARHCRYLVSWQKSRAATLKKIRNIIIPLLAVIDLILLFIPGTDHLVLVLGSASIIVILSWFAEYLDVRELRAAVDSLSDASDKLFDQINMNYNNALMINEIGQALSKEADIAGVLEQISGIMQKRLDYDRGLVMLANPAKTRLLYRAGYGYTEDQLVVLKKIAFHLDNPESQGVFTVSYREKRAILLNDIDQIKDELSSRSYDFAKKMGVKSLICCPIVYEEEPLGILAVDNIRSKRPLLQRDINLLMGVAPQIGTRIHSLMLEVQLRQTQKMEAVGSLAGGVAHDFNNILTTILGYSELIIQQLPTTNRVRNMVEAIYQAGKKAAGLTRQLLAFSRKQVMEMKMANLNTIVEDMGKMLSRLIGEDIEMELITAQSLGNIMADVGQIEQILMNLVVNARDAMPCGGRLTIETGEVYLDEQYAQAHNGLRPGHYALLTVTDTGEGMTAEVRDRVFEPFFTTKEKDKGTGLGLSTVYGIVKQHNGHITISSQPEMGTTFKIYFPIIMSGSVDGRPGKQTTTMARGTESILVVDDDPSIRRLIFDTLEPLGYKLMEASCGKEAYEHFKTTPEKIDLVLSDVIMPGMNGRELVKLLKQERPEIKTVLMSGYTDNIIAKHGVLDQGIVFINKPLLPLSLANTIRSTLDGSGE